mgnify:CR=1 FL=1
MNRCYFPKRSFVAAIGSMELSLSSFFMPLIASNTLCTTSSDTASCDRPSPGGMPPNPRCHTE